MSMCVCVCVCVCACVRACVRLCVTVKIQFDNTSICKYSIILALRSVAMLISSFAPPPPIPKFWIRILTPIYLDAQRFYYYYEHFYQEWNLSTCPL